MCGGREKCVFHKIRGTKTDSINACAVLKQRYLSELLVCALQRWYLQIGHCCICDIFAQSGATLAKYLPSNH